jgi:hypothetical protein
VHSEGVYRPPLRSRRDDVDRDETLSRARAHGVCGFGGRLTPPPADVASALEGAAQSHGLRFARRLARFAAVADGSFVWTRDSRRLLWLGQLVGPYFYDSSSAAEAVDLVNVRTCTWRERPVTESMAPAAVVATFDRGGRNFQQIHAPKVVEQTRGIWNPQG